MSLISTYLKPTSTQALGMMLISLSACTWVNVNDSGKTVAIVSARHIQDCTKIGNIDVSTKASLLGIQRNQKKVVTELETLARNKASSLEADTLVAVDKPIEGVQKYHAYNCH